MTVAETRSVGQWTQHSAASRVERHHQLSANLEIFSEAENGLKLLELQKRSLIRLRGSSGTSSAVDDKACRTSRLVGHGNFVQTIHARYMATSPGI
ncbi:hypothetical protein AXG93_961s1220 [Marchantia polymorpha subsp. ruderalis]|uniref:Uncharacterized protein n=1 Tax=Marchantia polymorpha subsp. ruderalis TaxID=1480154 RepID=A0A176VU75_MARPO|nr:hypothetical protein AXG93_961s1220 [Marchantia polymorpha subsp. ruderalis]